MSPRMWTCVWSLAIGCAAWAGEAPGGPEAPAELTDKLKAGVELLKHERFMEFVEQFIPPSVQADIKKAMPLKEFAAQFKGARAEQLARIFQAALKLQPKLSAAGDIVTFPAAGPGTAPLSFQKLNGTWYLRDEQQ